MSELEPSRRSKKIVAPRHIPQVIVPIPIDEVREFVHDAVRGTRLVNPVASAYSGWTLFAPRVRYTAEGSEHTRIELDVVEVVRGAEMFMSNQRRGEIDRFFVAIQVELDRRARWRSPEAGTRPAIGDEGASELPAP